MREENMKLACGNRPAAVVVSRLALLAVMACAAMHALADAPPANPAWLRPAASVPNGRQILDRDGGRFWAMVPDWQRGTLQLQVLYRQSPTGEFAVEGQVRVGDFDPSQTQTAMVMDKRGRWQWAYSDGKSVRYQALQSAQVAECLSRGSALPQAGEQWKVGHASLGDMLLLPEGEAPCVGVVRSEDSESVVTLWWKAGGWHQWDIARGPALRPPAMDVAGDYLYLSWCDGGGRIWFQKIRWRELGKAAPEAPQDIQGINQPGRRPSILCADGKVFVAYETMVAYSQTTAKVLEGQQWRTFHVTAPRLAPDVTHSPHLTLDANGVPWLFFSDANRRFVYYARWLGEGWSDIADGRGIFQRAPYYDGSLLSADWLSVEKHSASDQIGMVLANSSSGVASFQTMPVVTPKAMSGRRILFLDMLEVAQTEGLQRVFVPAVKDKANPVFTPSPDPKAFDSLRVFNHGTVRYEEGRFRMWYPGMGLFPGSIPWWRQLKIGYAESLDGRSFHRVELPAGNGLGFLAGDIPTLPFVVPLCRDDDDSDPARRYKLIDFLHSGVRSEAAAAGSYDLDAQFDPGFLYTSPDGTRWTREPLEIHYPGGKPLEFVPLCLLKDPGDPDPQRRWKAYGFMAATPTRRAGGMAYSPDARHWTGHFRNPVLDPQTSRMPLVPSGILSQIHDMVVWRDAGLYLSLFQDQRSKESLPLELAISRDGEHFVYVQPGEPFIPEGGPDDWDSLELLPSPPVDRGEEIWFYYAGSARGHGKPDEGRRTSAGLARARKDGFTCLQPAGGRTAGSLTTVPFQPAGRCRLFVNAACADGKIRVELLGADGRPLEHHAAAQCRPVTGDGVHLPVAWADGEVARPSGPFRIRFSLEGRDVRIFSFGFDPPS